MRLPEVARDAQGLGPHDHLCWSYDDDSDFRARAGEFLRDGLASGQRVLYLGAGEAKGLADDLRTTAGMDDALASGAAQVASIGAAYPVGTVIGPAEQVRVYAEATEQAVAAGFTGLRVAADSTSLVGTPAQLDAFARYEHRIDHYLAAHPFSALCGYNRPALGDDVVAQIACMHPQTGPSRQAFRLYASRRQAGCTALSGEFDLSTKELLTTSLDRAALLPVDNELVLDAAELTFIDHRSLLVLAKHARRHAASLVLRTSWSGASRLVEVLQMTNVRIEPAI